MLRILARNIGFCCFFLKNRPQCLRQTERGILTNKNISFLKNPIQYRVEYFQLWSKAKKRKGRSSARQIQHSKLVVFENWFSNEYTIGNS